ncbi:DUF4236 domain-containing protein [Natranaerobius trueperi]|nr:DUF4236 domain-containing protein [Natranaerobius trueperi]
MGIRFRRSMKLGKGLRVNLSKRGAGISLGGKGMRFGVGPKGAYRSMSIPGTGIYAIDYLNKSNRKKSSTSKTARSTDNNKDPLPMPQDLKSFNYPSLCIILMLILLPFLPIASVFLLAIAVYGKKQLANSSKGKARDKFKTGKKALTEGDYEKAREVFTELLKIQEIPQLYPILGELFLKNNEYTKACNYFEKYLDHNPKHIGVKFQYALSLKLANNFDQAINIFQDILNNDLSKEDESRVKVISHLGDCFMKKDNPELALEVLKSGPVRARKLDEDKMYFKYLLGLAYKENGQNDRAITHLQRVYAHDTNFYNVSQLLEELGKI